MCMIKLKVLYKLWQPTFQNVLILSLASSTGLREISEPQFTAKGRIFNTLADTFLSKIIVRSKIYCLVGSHSYIQEAWLLFHCLNNKSFKRQEAFSDLKVQETE